ncbi:conserved protein, unknown function [Hepatocystis sp. ex Piliocolobus tephrosceles]|nr:conserved protein, unknown function [Hepatocystis sp. ex Piliocolobus tephrosceles]VWU52373.1 conserved protein, unknown function [Hepatocystis sp. ex Piliocolobus tephrosceles]
MNKYAEIEESRAIGSEKNQENTIHTSYKIENTKSNDESIISYETLYKNNSINFKNSSDDDNWANIEDEYIGTYNESDNEVGLSNNHNFSNSNVKTNVNGNSDDDTSTKNINNYGSYIKNKFNDVVSGGVVEYSVISDSGLCIDTFYHNVSKNNDSINDYYSDDSESNCSVTKCVAIINNRIHRIKNKINIIKNIMNDHDNIKSNTVLEDVESDTSSVVRTLNNFTTEYDDENDEYGIKKCSKDVDLIIETLLNKKNNEKELNTLDILDDCLTIGRTHNTNGMQKQNIQNTDHITTTVFNRNSCQLNNNNNNKDYKIYSEQQKTYDDINSPTINTLNNNLMGDKNEKSLIQHESEQMEKAVAHLSNEAHILVKQNDKGKICICCQE